MDFLKNVLVSAPGLWGSACPHRWPGVAGSGRSQDPSCCHLAGSPWCLLAYRGVWKPPVTQGKEEQRLGTEGTVCVEGTWEGVGQNRGPEPFLPGVAVLA